MSTLKYLVMAILFVASTTFYAGANESATEPAKEHGAEGAAAEHSATPSEPAQDKNSKKGKRGGKKASAAALREVEQLDTEDTIKRIIGDGRDSAPKKKSARKKKAVHAAEHSPVSAHGGGAVDAEEAVRRLMEGNRRYVAGKNSAIHRTAQRRAEVAKGQHPYAIIVGCSDSRVPPEILFDEGLGDLFVIRSAGNVIDDIAIGSMEYAVEHLGVQLIMVLDHERCGAVDATLKGGEVSGKLNSVVEAIRPAVEKAKAKGQVSHSCDLLCSSVKGNARMVAEKIKKSSPLITDSIESGMLRVVGAYYELESGVVTLTYKPVL